jgi:hypothetical protein
VEHFEDDDDNNNNSDDVEDVSIHGSWITRRYPCGKQFGRRNEKLESESLARRTNVAQLHEEGAVLPFRNCSLWWNSIDTFRRTELRCAGYVLRAFARSPTVDDG